MIIWPIWLSIQLAPVNIDRKRIVTHNQQLVLTMLEEMSHQHLVTQWTSHSWLLSSGMGRRDSSTTIQQLAWMRMETLMKMESLKPVEDTLRCGNYIFPCIYFTCYYTQMVWARTYALGCGAYRCQELEGAEDNNENAVFLVCYYGPGWVIWPQNFKLRQYPCDQWNKLFTTYISKRELCIWATIFHWIQALWKLSLQQEVLH